MNIRGLSTKTLAKNKHLCQQFQRVAVCASGGIDSTALLYVFYEWSKKKYFSDLIILHVNFGLRGAESNEDERFLKRLATELGLKIYVLNVKKSLKNKPYLARLKKESIQMWARRVRHTWFQTFHDQGYQLALGHTADDVAENVLMRLARGSQLENAAGMTRRDGLIWRPFISFTKKDLKEALEQSKKVWREDSSNQKSIYARNRLRLDVLPILDDLYPGATQRLAASGLELSKRLSSSVAAHSSGKQVVPDPVDLATPNRSRSKVLAVQAFYKSALPGQALDLGDAFKLTKTAPGARSEEVSQRAQQHIQSLDSRQFELIIPSDTRIFVSPSAEHTHCLGKGLKPLEVKHINRSSAVVFIKRPASGDKVRIAGSNVTFKFKDLMQKWKVTVKERTNFVVIEPKTGFRILQCLQDKFVFKST